MPRLISSSRQPRSAQHVLGAACAACHASSPPVDSRVCSMPHLVSSSRWPRSAQHVLGAMCAACHASSPPVDSRVCSMRHASSPSVDGLAVLSMCSGQCVQQATPRLLQSIAVCAACATPHLLQSVASQYSACTWGGVDSMPHLICSDGLAVLSMYSGRCVQQSRAEKGLS